MTGRKLTTRGELLTGAIHVVDAQPQDESK